MLIKSEKVLVGSEEVLLDCYSMQGSQVRGQKEPGLIRKVKSEDLTLLSLETMERRSRYWNRRTSSSNTREEEHRQTPEKKNIATHGGTLLVSS